MRHIINGFLFLCVLTCLVIGIAGFGLMLYAFSDHGILHGLGAAAVSGIGWSFMCYFIDKID